ncbi:ATP-dependent nuclease [Curtobacterium sp. NPDC092190]|uniref:ATP-dependent nuclease n=1 Tax=Curtobacterium sp. NPDC092190 TaxID=3363973 RepID=UPI00380F95EE
MAAPTAPKLTSAWDSARHADNGWPQFLTAVRIEGLRGSSGEQVEFRYPVVAIAGANGSGKSTILKAAAAAYRAPSNTAAASYSPDDFFPRTPWEDVEGVVLTYTIRLGATTDTVTVRKPTRRWRGAPERKTRSSFFLDISRVQPANMQIGYGRTAQDVISSGTTEPLDAPGVAQLSRALGRTYDQARLDRSEDKQVGVLTQAGVEYSNFHQGAGEDSMLDLVALLTKAPDRSLVIIDEVEASLHPQAQRGLVTELLRLALDKKLQVILSTHSPFILEQLPSLARVLIAVDRDGQRQVLYGVSSDFALNKMDDKRHEELDIFCEDEEAQYLIERILALGAPETLERVSITPVGPAQTVIALASVAVKDKLSRAAWCVVDADQESSTDYGRLPGSEAPEKETIQALSDHHWSTVAERLGRPAGEVLDARDKALLIENHHAWTKEMARQLGGTMQPRKVWEAIADVWTIDVFGEHAAKEWSESVVEALR